MSIYNPNGEDAGALVVDIGSGSCKVGYAGDDVPKHIIPSLVGMSETRANKMGGIDEIEKGKEKEKEKEMEIEREDEILVDIFLNNKARNTEIRPLLRDGLIDDWDAFDTMYRYLCGKMTGIGEKKQKATLETSNSSSEDHSSEDYIYDKVNDNTPILFVEPPHNTSEKRKQLCEYIFESARAPALFALPPLPLAPALFSLPLLLK